MFRANARAFNSHRQQIDEISCFNELLVARRVGCH